MKSPIRIILLILAFIMLFAEGFMGLPFLGGSYILSLGWAPLGSNITMYFVMFLITILDRSNESRSALSTIAAVGMFANIIAFIPIVGMFMHWLMAILMLVYIFIVLNTREYRGNTTHYDRRRAGETVREYRK
ncbi:hypothetical protein [Macrococcoides caseolyticum]|uniref:hypothetical protein n=1 Tax=Macrococcoides caseolyticum TaxID=69966 RepID=UPI001F2783D1|nr:hypothetical protein [Macrococcus caseolyticus]MCE4957871.1 hypothetical protein [Macrococcus caseolyticus]